VVTVGADDVLLERFAAFATTASDRIPLYAQLSAGIAHRPELARLLIHADPQQRLPVLLFAAVHFLVLEEPDSELARFYPNLTAQPDRGDPLPAFAAFCAAHHDELVAVLATRSTQTNEVGRCALLVPPLGLVANENGPLGLLDVGTSAGLNLALDRYQYRYEPGGDVGNDSPVVLSCGTRGAVQVPDALPPIGSRLGLDRNPVDLDDEAEVRWLEACVWPDQAERFHRLRAAVELTRHHPPPVRTGDAVVDLAAAIEHVGRDHHPVVTNTWVLNYLAPDERTAYLAVLADVGAERDLSWIYAESPSQVGPEIPVPEDPDLAHTTVLTLVRWRSGERSVAHLGVAHPHGDWLHWH